MLYCSHAYYRQGYTLVELLVTLVVIGVLTSLGYQGIQGYLKHSESMTTRGDLQNFLSTGKQYATIYQNPIHLCVANESRECVTQNGTVLLSFIDKDHTDTLSEPDKLLEIHPLDLKYAHLSTNIALAKPYIVFAPQSARPTGYMGNIKYCPTDGDVKERFKITFSKTAIIRIKLPAEEPTEC